MTEEHKKKKVLEDIMFTLRQIFVQNFRQRRKIVGLLKEEIKEGEMKLQYGQQSVSAAVIMEIQKVQDQLSRVNNDELAAFDSLSSQILEEFQKGQIIHQTVSFYLIIIRPSNLS